MADKSINSKTLSAKLIFQKDLKRLTFATNRLCYNIYILWLIACLVANPIMVGNFAPTLTARR